MAFKNMYSIVKWGFTNIKIMHYVGEVDFAGALKRVRPNKVSSWVVEQLVLLLYFYFKLNAHYEMENILDIFMEIIVMNCKVVFASAARLLFSKGVKARLRNV